MQSECHACGKACGLPKAKLRCARCKYAVYCDRDCQVADYKTHRDECMFIDKIRAANKAPLLRDAAFLAFMHAVHEGHRMSLDASLRLIDMKRQVDAVSDMELRKKLMFVRATEMEGVSKLLGKHARQLVNMLRAFYHASPVAESTPLTTVQNVLTQMAAESRASPDKNGDGPSTVLIAALPLRDHGRKPMLLNKERTYEIMIFSAASMSQIAGAITQLPDFGECPDMTTYMKRNLERLDDAGFIPVAKEVDEEVKSVSPPQ